MLTIFFVYGLAFIILGIVVFTAREKTGFLDISREVWLIGLFGLVHGINEWVDMLILIGRPFDTRMLVVIGSILLPVSFLCLVFFGCRVIARTIPRLKFLYALPYLIVIAWIPLYLAVKDLTVITVITRYFIGIPGTVLTAAAIYLKASKKGVPELPRVIRISALGASASFLMYGLLAGIVVPKSDFLFSQVLNYPNFIKVTGIPVQFFRVLVAITLSACFFGIFGVVKYSGGKTRRVGGIRRRVTLLIFWSTFAIATFGVGLWFYLGYDYTHSMIGKDYGKMAQLLAVYVADSIKQEIQHVESYSNSPLWKKQILDADDKLDAKTPASREAFYDDMERKWPGLKDDDPLLKEYLDNYVAVRLKTLSEDEGYMGEVFVTDRFGGIVASSRKTSDFYQADEDWWQYAYNGGNGADYVGDIEFDQSSKLWGIALAVPIRDGSGNIIGICKAFLEAGVFFNPLQDFRIGRTGHAAIINNKGDIIFHYGVEPMTMKICGGDCLEAINSRKAPYFVGDDLTPHEGKIFVVCADIPASLFSMKDVSWKILIEQDEMEAFAPVNKFLFILVIVWSCMIAIIIPAGYYLGGIFAKPINELHVATEKVMEGDWDYRIEANTGDEIEQFAETFRDMISAIKVRRDALITAKDELEVLSKQLEKRVGDRTKDLSDAQAASLNLLEDIQEEKEKVEKYSRDLESALRIKADFTSMVSHELRTPLTAIKEGISLVIDGTTGELNKDQKEFLNIAKRNVDRLARLINDVLDLQKLESGKMTFSLAPGDINGVVREVYDTMITMVKDKALEIVLDLSGALPAISFDRDKITQVLTNLVNNAVKFTDKGRITVITEIKDGMVRVTVKDSGPGIHEEDLPRLFRRFEQLEKGTERKTGGTGLGLAISKEIVERHGGKIWAESAYGQGASFIFTLPIAERKESYDEDHTYSG
ncbi:MAG: ATP-binding protein [Candidatus Omnitrophota bacterium]